MSIPDLCDNIQVITDTQENTNQRTPLKRQLSSHTRESLQRNTKKVHSESLEKMNNQFKQQHNEAILIWKDWTCSTCRSLVSETLRSKDNHFVFSATNWDVVSIQEEGEGGEKVKSTIRVPSMVRFD